MKKLEMVVRKIILVAICFSVLGSVLSVVGQAAEKTLTMKGATDRETHIFMAGAAQALAYANVYLLASGKTPVYCKNDGMFLNGSGLWKLASERMEGEWEPAHLMAGVVTEVRKAYPCR